MIFSNPDFTIKEKIELLERSILVNSFAYYELNENILSDFKYDANTRQLLELIAEYPEIFRKSRYYRYFDNFESGTGFDLSGRMRKNKKLYKKIERDATWALKLKQEKGEKL